MTSPDFSRARQLTLVNWRGVSYRDYALDPALTTLQGGNGAGKTTVMIAAFVVLMPDQSLLRFQALGEGRGGGDSGLLGRLGGEAPAYSVLVLEGRGGRVAIGVQLRPRGQELDIRPFMIDGLAAPEALRELLVETLPDARLRVLDLPELRRRAHEAGAACTTFETLRDYLDQLYELGLTSLPMQDHAERARFHRVLHTSLYGGLSGDIQRGLRSYLLTEDRGIGNAVREMRDNLDRCQRNRLEIERLAHHAGRIETLNRRAEEQAEAAWLAARTAARAAAAQALRGRADGVQATRALRAGIAREDAAGLALQAAEAARERARERREQAEAERSDAAAARAEREQLDAAEARRADAARQLDAAQAHEQALAAEHATLQAREQTEERDYQTLGHEVGNLQAAYDGAYRRDAVYRGACAALEAARTALAAPGLAAEAAAAHHARLLAERQALAARLAALRQQHATAAAQRQRFDAAYAALARVADPLPAPADAHATARALDAGWRELEAALEHLPALRDALRRHERLAPRQARLRSLAATLDATDAATYRAALAREHARAEELLARIEAAAEERQALLDARRDADARHAETARRADAWREARNRADALHAACGRDVDSEAAWRALAEALEAEHATLHGECLHAEAECARLDAEHAALRARLHGEDPELVRLAELCAGEPLSRRYDELDEAAAAEAEAQLGPLAQALVVPDLAAAAVALVAAAPALDTLWLLGPGEAPAAQAPSADWRLVEQGAALRLSRVPAEPTLGRAARLRACERLEARCAAQRRTLRALEARREDLQRSLACSRALAAHAHALDWHAAGAELATLAAERDELGRQLSANERTAQALRREHDALALRLREWQAAEPEAELLDAEDHADAAAARRRALAELEARGRAFDRDAARALRRLLPDLEAPPTADPVALAAACAACEAEAQALEATLLAVETLAHAVAQGQFGPAYAGAAAELAESQDLLATRREQQERQALALQATRAERDRLRPQLNDAVAEIARLGGECGHLQARVAEHRARLGRHRHDGSAAALTAATAAVAAAASALDEAERRRDAAVAARSAAMNARERAADHVNAARDRYAAARQTLHATRVDWRAARAAAHAHAAHWLGRGPLAAEAAELDAEALRRRATGSCEVLRELLFRDEQAHALCDDGVKAALAGDAGAALALWAAVRRHLLDTLPLDAAALADLGAALGQLQRRLTEVRDSLASAEDKLRMSSADVVYTLGQQIRRERSRIQRFNAALGDAAFGAIYRIRINAEPHPHMLDVLHALGGQGELFHRAELSLEDALAELYREVTGGQIQGERLLDYREYLDLRVEVNRFGAQHWEVASSSTLSTGETIGTGIAVLIMALKAWEDSAALKRSRRRFAPLRFMFLDEASRLDRDALATLRQLCERMPLQLLVAAPQVDRAHPGIGYLLERILQDGRERVISRRIEIAPPP